MTVSSVRALDANTSQLAATIHGVEWSSIRCHLENGALIIDGDGEIPGAVREWIAAGNTPEPYTVPALTEADYSAAIQAHIDATARVRGYADGVSCCSYHDSANPTWVAESAAFKTWRDSVWLYAFAQLDAVQNNQRPQPTVAELVAELPAIEWPS